MSEMTEERLAELRETRDMIRAELAAGHEADDMVADMVFAIAEAVDEIDRLRDEIERLQYGPLVNYINLLLIERNEARAENVVLRQAFAVLTTTLPDVTP